MKSTVQGLMPNLPQTRQVLMVCAHEPTMDPRIRWEAEWAAGSFDVTVLGFNKADKSKPDVEFANGYKIVRLVRHDIRSLHYIVYLGRALPRPAQFAFLLLALPLAPVFLLAAMPFWSLQALRWLLNLLASASLRGRAGRIPALRRLLGRFDTAPLRATARRIRDRLAFTWMERVHFINLSLWGAFAPATVLFCRHIGALHRKPDVIHCNDLETLLVGVLAKKKYGCRVIYDAHEFWPFADPLCTWVDRSFFTLVEAILTRESDAVVSVSPLLSDAIRRTYGLAHVHTVPNVEPWVADRQPPAGPSGMARLAGCRVRFLFQGRFTRARGIEEIITAWRYVDGSKAALFLRGPDNSWRSQAITLTAEQGLLNTSVYFLDPVSEDELVSAASEADVGIVPYLPVAINERLSCPNKLSQYLHAGLMIITNDLPFVRSVVEDAKAGLWYTSHDITTLAQAVSRVIGDPELLRMCKQNALRFAQHSFNWQNYGDLLLQLYLGGHGEMSGAVGAEARGMSHRNRASRAEVISPARHGCDCSTGG